uniref:Odorant-binding protein 9 n=1 Tax=Pyrrhalta aenescens TaxID=281545 RepID=A0A1J0KKM1_9CUCU|nr:odorant-binding protein 9 [Pyrrhalta aenescens]
MMFFVIFAYLCLMELCQAEMLAPEMRSKLLEHGEKCYKEAGTDMEVLLKTKEGIFPDDPKLKKQLFCMNKSFGIQQENGEYNEAVMKTILKNNGADDKKADELTKKCLVKKDDPEDSALEMTKCIYSIIPPEEIRSLYNKM